MAFLGGVSVYARPKALYLFVQQKLRNFNKKSCPKIYMPGSWEPSAAAPPPTKLHTFGDLHSTINLPTALSALRDAVAH